MSILFDSEDEDVKPITCYCKGHCPHGEEYGNCETKPGGKCFTSVELETDDDDDEYIILSYGCLPPNEMASFQCRSTLIAARNRINIKCCDEYDYCNKHLLPVVSQKYPKEQFPESITIKVLIASLLICFIAFTIVLIFVYLRHRRKEKINHNVNKVSEEVQLEKIINISNLNNVINFPGGINGENSIKLGLESSLSRSSMDDFSGLVQRTISKQIRMEMLIASGTYGEVWRAKWRGEKVAVKIYVSNGEHMWLRETDIYQTVLMRHDHILGFIAADIKENGPKSQLLVITEYHERGSLSDYLRNNTVIPRELLQMIKGLSSGLNHLHNEIFGCKGKPAIAHNNINSRNILVKRNKECCLGDFKKAVKYFNSQNIIDAPNDTENTQIRYLAPEILEDTFDSNNFESFKMSDVYSFSLVVWEIANRCHLEPLLTKSTYRLPYEEELSLENQEELRDSLVEVVVKKKVRPILREEWEEDAILKVVARTILECWNPNPFVRLTSLRIKKNFFKLHSENVEL